VLNHSFEVVDSCHYLGKSGTCKPWLSIPFGTGVDAYNICHEDSHALYDRGVPRNREGYQYPRTGNGYGGFFGIYKVPIIPGGVRTYMEGQLISVLKKGKLYFVSFYINFSAYDTVHFEQDMDGSYKIGIPCPTDGIGALLSDSLVNNKGLKLLPYRPSVQNRRYRALEDTVNWQNVSGLITASGNERYITIGDFSKDSNEHSTCDSASHNWYDFYYLDDVSVIPCNVVNHDTSVCSGTVLTYPHRISSLKLKWQNDTDAAAVVISDSGNFAAVYYNDSTAIVDSFHVRWIGAPHPLNVHDTILCEGQTLVIPLPQDSGVSYLLNGSAVSNSIHITTTGYYGITQKYAQCGRTDSIYVLFNKPVLNFLPKDTFFCDGDSLHIDLGNIPFRVQWDNGTQSLKRGIKEAGIYYATITNTCGTFTDTMVVTKQNCICDMYAPNAFSPNKDGLNDSFKVESDCDYQSFQLSIYNRWGERVFQSNDIHRGWDGTYHEKKCEPGIYCWTLSTITQGKGFVHAYRHGSIMLLW
jgi:gliding motility-associated-like protein